MLSRCQAFFFAALLSTNGLAAQTPPARAFPPLVVPVPDRPRTVEQRICDASAPAARNARGSLVVATATRSEPLDLANPYHIEALYRWLVGALARTGAVPEWIARRPSPERALVDVRTRYEPAQALEALCAVWTQAAPTIPCAPRFRWSAAFRRADWCAAAERGTPLRPEAAVMPLPGTLQADVCFAPAVAVADGPLPCLQERPFYLVRTGSAAPGSVLAAVSPDARAF